MVFKFLSGIFTHYGSFYALTFYCSYKSWVFFTIFLGSMIHSPFENTSIAISVLFTVSYLLYFLPHLWALGGKADSRGISP